MDALFLTETVQFIFVFVFLLNSVGWTSIVYILAREGYGVYIGNVDDNDDENRP